MNLEQALEYTVTKKQAKKEIELHFLSFKDFLNDVGDKKNYQGFEVLNWLGY